jgi:ElaB/YqjD/DUF883 family membrane-anchored ribosome-binding protein
MTRQILLVVVLGCISTAAWAQMPDVLPDGATYPDPQCTKPQTNLVKPESGNSAAVGNYNMKVRKFNRDAVAYDACLHAYIDKANRDVQRIQDKANADLKEITTRANASMKAIQDKVRQAVADGNSVATGLDQDASKLRSQKLGAAQ